MDLKAKRAELQTMREQLAGQMNYNAGQISILDELIAEEAQVERAALVETKPGPMSIRQVLREVQMPPTDPPIEPEPMTMLWPDIRPAPPAASEMPAVVRESCGLCAPAVCACLPA